MFATVGSIGMASGDNVQLDGISRFAAAMLSWCVAARATLTLDPIRIGRWLCGCVVSARCVRVLGRMRCVHLNETTMSEGVASQHRTFYTAHHRFAVRNGESPNVARSTEAAGIRGYVLFALAPCAMQQAPANYAQVRPDPTTAYD